MANGIGSYKGVWKKSEPSAPELPVVAMAAIAEPVAAFAAEPTQAAGANAYNIPLPPALLEHRYRLLVMQEHRYKLGRDLLETGERDPWRLAWASVISLGKSFRPWAHARYFAIGCYLGVDMSPEVLRQLRHPLQFGRYRRSMFGLWRLLEMLAQKNGHKPLPRWVFRLFYVIPPLAVLIYEKQLQALLTHAHEVSAAAQGPIFATGQGQ